MSSKFNISLLCTVGVVALASASSAYAQGGPVEQVTVTGSRIISDITLSPTPLTVVSVRRQNIWHSIWAGLVEHRPRLGVDVKRRACGVASVDVRWSVA